tara:strand:- start:602 stop:871 length:270 start_codon:yes stop_codon:yes gene_type:complete
MYIITLKGMSEEGAYAVQNEYGDKVVFMFEEKDDALRYAMLMEEEEDSPEMDVIEIPDEIAVGACEQSNMLYTVITKDDIVIPPSADND